MKNIIIILFLIVFSKITAQEKKQILKPQIVEVACGLCQFDIVGLDCYLAVRIDNKTYYVNGTTIDDHGDAHAQDGFCKAIRKAEVLGEIVGNRFRVTSFKLLPLEKK